MNNSLQKHEHGDGKVITDLGPFKSTHGTAVGLQQDSKIVLAGYGISYDTVIMRYNDDGTLDEAFGTNGRVVTPDFVASDMLIQADGKLVLVGSGANWFAVARYNSDGTLDNTFSDDGIAEIQQGSGNSGYAIVIQPDDRIVVAGEDYSEFGLARLNSDGSADDTFGHEGNVSTDINNGSHDGCWDIAIQSNGQIVAIGDTRTSGYSDFAVVRYNSDGTLDANFGIEGITITSISDGNDQGFATTLQSDDQIIVAGECNTVFALARYRNDGLLDTTFGTDGKVISFIDSGGASGQAVALQRDNKIVVAGWSSDGRDKDFALARYENEAINSQVYLPVILKD